MESHLEWHWRLTLALCLRLIPLWLLVVSSTPVCLRLAFMLWFEPHYNTVQHKNFAEVYFADWWFFCCCCFAARGRRRGLMVSALDSGASGPGSSPGRGHCVVFLGKTLNSHGASLHPRQVYKWVTANLMLGVILRWTSIPSRGE